MTNHVQVQSWMLDKNRMCVSHATGILTLLVSILLTGSSTFDSILLPEAGSSILDGFLLLVEIELPSRPKLMTRSIASLKY